MTDSASIADLTIVRIGGITAEQLASLPLHQTADLIANAIEIENDLRSRTTAIEEALYRLVPDVGGDTACRRRILAMKRHVHNLRLWPEADRDVAAIGVLLAEDDRWLLERWYARARERSELVARASDTYFEELERACRSLAAAMQDESIQQGLALASPDFLEQLVRKDYTGQSKDWRPAAQLARTALAYASRAALKTSPLSTFTQLQTARFRDSEKTSMDACPQQELESRRSMKLIKAVPLSLLVLIARHRELAPALQFAPNTGILKQNRNSTTSMILTHQYRRSGSHVWRTERMLERDCGWLETPAFLAFMESRSPRSYEELSSVVPITGVFTDAHDVITHLLDLQWIRPVAPYTLRDAETLTSLAACLRVLRTPLAGHVADQLDSTSILVGRLRTAGGPERLRLLGRIRESIGVVYQLLGAPVPSWLSKSKMVYEDVRYGGAPIELTEQVRRDLHEIARLIRPSFIRTRFYQFIYRHFVERFGPNGKTADVLDFLNSVLQRPDIWELFSLAIAEDRTSPEEMDGAKHGHLVPSVGEGASPPAVTIFFQVAAKNRQAFEQGDYKVILNQINAGQGGLLARFAEVLDGAGAQVRDRLRSWTRELYPSSIPVEVPIFGDVSHLQSATGLTDKILQWPGEMPSCDIPMRDQSILLSDLRLRADESTATLSFIDADGNVVSPTYLGVTPPHMTLQAAALLLVIADPWMCRYQFGLLNFGAQTPCRQAEFSPRREKGRIVLQRASWRFPANAVPLKTREESDFDYFVRVQLWRAEHQLPDEVFVRARRTGMPFATDARKPVWINFKSPHCLETLRQLIAHDDVESVSLTEVLPSREEHWFDYRVTEFMSLLRWPMPENAPRSVDLRPVQQTTHSADDWVCFHIYPRRFGLLDDIVQQVLPRVLATVRENGNLERWFFLRYIDTRGSHIRLRLMGRSEARKHWRRAIGTVLDEALHELSTSSVSGECEDRDRSLFNGPVEPGYSIEPYVPEYDKYGGAAGVVFAERLFDSSSNLVVQVLSSARQSALKRSALAVHLMNATIDSFARNEEERQGLLRHYLWYWSGQDAGRAAQKRLDAGCRAQKDSGAVDSDLRQIADDFEISGIVDEYRSQVACAIDDTRLTGERLVVPLSRFCFHSLHLTNNRLGIAPSDEAYMAALLLTLERSPQLLVNSR